jgi:glycerate-2-kinase
MRLERIRLAIPAVVALLVTPLSALAQSPTSTDAAIAELRQMMADQRAALDRQARIIEEQGRALVALQQQVDGANRPSPEQNAPVSRTSVAQAPDLPAAVVSAGEFPGSIRIPGTESAFKLGGQARMVAVHTLDALGTDDRLRHLLDPRGGPASG